MKSFEALETMSYFLNKHVRLIEAEVSETKNVTTFYYGLHALIVGSPDKAMFVDLNHRWEHDGLFKNVSPFDGEEHSYIELAEGLGGQGAALKYMALVAHFDLAHLLTPRAVLGETIPRKAEEELFGAGMCTIVAKPADCSNKLEKAEEHRRAPLTRPGAPKSETSNTKNTNG